MFAVIKHTFDINKEDKYNSYGEWKHLVWLFETEADALAFGISLLDNPVICGNEHSLAHAIETLQTGRYWQYGRESIAIGKVEERMELTTEEDTIVKKPIH